MPTVAQQATLVHGFTMADVENAARIASRRCLMRMLDETDRRDAAWHGVVEELYSCGCGRGHCTREDELTFRHLIFAGIRAVDTEQNHERRHHGFTTDWQAAPRFLQYWGADNRPAEHTLPSRKPKRRTDDGFFEHLCELIALREALPRALGELTVKQYEAMTALAAFDNVGQDAADALGLANGPFWDRIHKGRRRIKAVWHDELPQPPAKPDEPACQRGHLRAEHGKQKAQAGGLVWVCIECQRAYDREWKRSKRAAQRVTRELQAEAEAPAEADRDPAA